MVAWASIRRLPLALLLLLAEVACPRVDAAGRALKQTATNVTFNNWVCETGGSNPVGYVWCKGAYLGGSQGSILRTLVGSTNAQREAACNADANCVAWDTNGNLRYAVKPTAYWTTVTGSNGTYIKTGVIPGAQAAMQVPGYDFVYGKDSDGYPISGGNILAAPLGNSQVCTVLGAACAGFNAHKAQFKSRIKPKECWVDVTPSWNQNDGLYVKQGTVLRADDPAPAIAGFTTYQNLNDNTYNSVRVNNGTNMTAVAAACAADATCKAFDTNGWLKSNLAPSTNWVAFGSAICNPNLAMYVKPAPAATTQKIGIWIPFYNSQQDYDKLVAYVEGSDCLKGSFKAAVLIGPDSGPPAPGDAAYQARFAKVANTQEWTTFGYLHTNYSNRPLNEVLAQIDTWLTKGAGGYGDQIQGVWINQVPPAANTPELQAYFQAIVDRARFYGGQVAFNPGMDMTDCKLAAMADYVNSFENTYAVWKSSGAKCTCAKSTICIASIHGYDGPVQVADLSAVMADAVSRGFQGTFVTDGVMPNQYSALPAFWSTEIQAVCKTVI